MTHFAFCNQLSPHLSKAKELGMAAGGALGTGLQGAIQLRKLCSVPGRQLWDSQPPLLRKSGQSQNPGLCWACQEMLSLGCPCDLGNVWRSWCLWSLLSSSDMSNRASSTGAAGALQEERMALFLESIILALLSRHIHVTNPCWGHLPAPCWACTTSLG